MSIFPGPPSRWTQCVCGIAGGRLFLQFSPHLPVTQWLDARRLAIIPEPGIHCEPFTATSISDYRSPVRIKDKLMADLTFLYVVPLKQSIVK